MTGHGQLLRESLATIERLEARLHHLEKSNHAALAIVGAGCRFPGSVETPEGLWRLVRDGVDAVSEIPADRWDRDAYYDADPKAPGKMSTRRGGFLAQVDRFEPQLFGISPREAATMDPQQRLLLETAWEALESAAIPTDRLTGSSTGVYVGITSSDYGHGLRLAGTENSDVYSATGSALNAAAGRLAFTFGLQGPCVAVDTACSSSLVAVHLACQSLRAGESDLALAGGVNVILSPDAMILFSKWGMMAPDGACKTFDAAADGFVRSEGCAIIAIKRLADALAAGDPILSVIRGSAVNSDGRSSGLTVPSGPAQRAVVQKALASADLQPADIDYVEAHGTGTSLGDPIEVEALAAVMRQGRPPERPLLIGSIKTNIGHAESASGIAGLLKVVAALRNEAIPPHLHFTTPNPGIPWASLPLRVPTSLTAWPRGERKRRAGVSAFGFSGTNAHVVLEEAPAVARPPVAESVTVVPLSAREEGALRELAQRTADRVTGDAGLALADVAVTTATGRAHLGRRLAIVAASRDELVRDLHAFAAGETPASAAQGTLRPGERPKVAFVFTGQGSQYAGMGKGLYESEPVFRKALDRAAAVLTPLLGRPLLDVIFPAEGAATPLGETAFTQPALFALEYALAELWRSWGVVPSAVLGHSVGEYVAATVAGVMSLEDGLALVAERGRLMQALPAGGGMAAIFASEGSVARRIERWSDRLAIAALNGPEETVVSGDAKALAEVVAACAADGVQCRTLDVSHAFHSPLLDPMLEALERRAAAVPTTAPRMTLLSNVTGAAFAAGARPDAAYWRRHAREPVRFAASIEALKVAGVTTLVEIGPHPTLLGLVSRALPSATWTAVPSLRKGRDDRREMLSALSHLYARGASIGWDAVHADRPGRRVPLPTYPFQRQRHWVNAATPGHAAPATGHPLLGARRELASAPGTYVWESAVSLDALPWLGDHRVQGAAIVPATAYIEMAIAAGREVLAKGPVGIDEIENLKPLILREGDVRSLQATLVVREGQPARFSVHSRLAGSTAPWIGHVSAHVAALPAERATEGETLTAIRARCTRELEGAAFYEAAARKGNQWGPCFQGMEHVWLGEGEAVGRVRVPAPLAGETARYMFHPAVSDSCGHVLVSTVPLSREGAFVGGGVGEIRFTRSPSGTTLWTHARLRPPVEGQDRLVVGDVRVYDESGALVSETLGARLWYLDASSSGAVLGVPEDWYYEVRWKKQDLAGPAERKADPGAWIVFGEGRGVAAAIAAQRTGGPRTVLVTAGDRFSLEGDRATVRPSDLADLRQLFEAVANPAAVLHLASMGSGPEAAPWGGAESVATLLQAIVATSAARRPRLWLVTAEAQAALPGDRCDDPFGAVLWGMGRALSAEHAELWGGLVDISSRAGADVAAGRLIQEVDAGARDDRDRLP